MTIDTPQNKIQSFAFCLALSIAVCLSVCFAVSGFHSFGQSCEVGLESRINPNFAPPASLVRLPGIGIVRAEAIAAYREDFGKMNDDITVFGDCGDLQQVKGIGPKTAERICEWLEFE